MTSNFKTLIAAFYSVILIADLQGQDTTPDNGCATFRLITWNMQSDFDDARKESDPDFLAKQMAEKGAVDIWALTEVLNQDSLSKFEKAIEEKTGCDYEGEISNSGNTDRLAILFCKKKFKKIGDFEEISSIQYSKNARPGFKVTLEEIATAQRFIFIVNHFKCCGGSRNIRKRISQARALNAYAESQSLPVIAAGDFNTPFREREEHRLPAALNTLINEGPFEWSKPSNLVRTHKGGPILDYVFVANSTKDWEVESLVLKREGNAPASKADSLEDNHMSTDHRPVQATFEIHCGDRVEEISEEIEELKARLRLLNEELSSLNGNQSE